MEKSEITSQTPYVATTHNVRVSVTPEYMDDRSDVQNDSFAFAYTILIENLGKETVQLLERHWHVFSGGEEIAEVQGPGVVGVQPVLNPGESFEYTSGTIIHNTSGSMRGTYTLRKNDGTLFEVTIPEFDLVYPMMLH